MAELTKIIGITLPQTSMGAQSQTVEAQLWKGKVVSIKTVAQMRQEDKTLARPQVTPQLNATHEAPLVKTFYGLSEADLPAKIQEFALECLARKRLEPGFTKDYQGGEFGDALEATITPVGFLDGKNIVVIHAKLYEKGFTLPAYATDIVPIIEADNGRIYGTLGIRLNPPGKDKAATFGGFNNVEANGRFVSPIGTAMLEVREEAGLKLTMSDKHSQKEIMEDHNLVGCDISVSATLGLKNVANKVTMLARICHLGNIKTSDEPMEKGGETRPGTLTAKRVHATSVVTMISKKTDVATQNVGFFGASRPAISETLLKRLFKGGDDISKALVFDFTDMIKNSPTYDDAVVVAEEFYKKQGMGIVHHAEVIAMALHKAHKEFHPDTYVPYNPAEKYNVQ